MVNIDEVDDHYEAIAYLNPTEEQLPSTVAYIKTIDKKSEQIILADTFPVNPRTDSECVWDDIKDLYEEGMLHSASASISVKLENGNLIFDAESDIGVSLSSELTRSNAHRKSEIVGKQMSWSDFKSYISEISRDNYLFRGQRDDWRLRTSYHRGGRYRISEFANKDVKQLHQRLSAITTHYFDLDIPNQNGAFFNLLQHHGYPTPLLDWSYSPYVAAFFAFRDLPIRYMGEDNVRVYIFDNDAWKGEYPQIHNLDPPYPHLSVMEFIAINNPRLVPQQAVTTVTNIDDIEAHVLQKEDADSTQYIRAIDIPANQREEAMSDLKFMGITAGAMFPTIDGVCEELREQNFKQ